MLANFMGFLQEFNVVGIAVWLIIATQVSALVANIIDDFITPLILAPLFRRFKVDNLEELSWNGVLYGKLIAGIIKFVIIAFLVFLVVKYLGVEKA